MTPDKLNKIKARCETESGLCENCNIERPCCTCINAPWQLRALYGCIAEIERLRGFVERIATDKGGDVWITFSFNPTEEARKLLEGK